MASQPARGTRDFLPDDVRKREHVTSIIRRVYESHGFEALETPCFERLETLLGKYGEEGDQLLFKVLLRGQPLVSGIRQAAELLERSGTVVHGRSGETAPAAEQRLSDLGLRYDLTVPLARVVAAHQGKLPAVFKRYQIQPVWRADTPGKGRFREFYQCDVDVIGSSSLLVEAEVASAACECMQRLGFASFRVRLNHRLLLKAVMQRAGIAAHQQLAAITALDKLDKIGLPGVEKELLARGIESASCTRLLEIVGESASMVTMREQLSGSDLGRQALSDVDRVLELAALTPAARHLEFDVSLARGLGYYTGCIFEIAVPDLAGSLGAGGRYDGLIGMFLGKDMPACGISLGLERILVVMQERGMFPAAMAHADVVLSATHEDDLGAALVLSQKLRSAGLRVDLRPKATKPGPLRKYADARGVVSAVWFERGQADHLKIWRKERGVLGGDLSPEALLTELIRPNQAPSG
ncbi:MAG: histidine--tRNA ligase [Proteobacteria bacterium]|nr:histidine--tRNA ligase [Pseudomonadota bacterium]